MSEIKTNEPVKQEGDFKIKSKPKKPKQLGNKEQEIPKVNLNFGLELFRPIPNPPSNLKSVKTSILPPRNTMREFFEFSPIPHTISPVIE